MINAPEASSTRPYLIRALYEWCTDNGLTPYVAVAVDDSVQVPREYVKDDEIVLNISFDATSSLKLGNEFIEFKARFAGKAREIMVPISHVMAIYARENDQGMAFPLEAVLKVSPAALLPAPAKEDKPTLEVRKSEGTGKIMQLVTDSAPAATASEEPPPTPPKTPKKPPALKRIK